MKIPLTSPIKIDDKDIKELNLKLEDLTGKEILKIDEELKMEGFEKGFNSVFDQNIQLRIASKSSGILIDDLQKLKARDFIEMTFSVRNFLLGWSEQTVAQEKSEKSLSN